MEKPIRVLHIVTCMNLGGLETMIMNYYRKLDTNKIQFDFLVHRKEKSTYDEEILQKGGKIYTVPKLNPFSIKYRNAMNGFFKKHNYNIVHCHLDCMSSIPLSIAKKNKVKIRIAHAHSTNEEKNFKYPLKLFYKRKIKTVATDLFACGYAAGKWMFATDSFTIMKNAIDTKKFLYNEEVRLQERKNYQLQDSLVIGHVGRFNIPKNHIFIIDVFNEIIKLNKNAKLVLVGEGLLKEEIKDKVNKLNLNKNVIFIGETNRVFDILNAFDIFLFPSLWEGLPVSLIEAQAASLPCFVSENIPAEVKITELVKVISLTMDASFWAKQIVNIPNQNRLDRSKEIKNNGYDIDGNFLELEEYYLYATKK